MPWTSFHRGRCSKHDCNISSTTRIDPWMQGLLSTLKWASQLPFVVFETWITWSPVHDVFTTWRTTQESGKGKISRIVRRRTMAPNDARDFPLFSDLFSKTAKEKRRRICLPFSFAVFKKRVQGQIHRGWDLKLFHKWRQLRVLVYFFPGDRKFVLKFAAHRLLWKNLRIG